MSNPVNDYLTKALTADLPRALAATEQAPATVEHDVIGIVRRAETERDLVRLAVETEHLTERAAQLGEAMALVEIAAEALAADVAHFAAMCRAGAR